MKRGGVVGVPLSPNVQSFLKEGVYANISTLMKDGSPQSSVVWVDTDGENLLVNSSINRVKTKNMLRDPRVSLTIMTLDNAYRGIYVRGRATSITEDSDLSFIDSLAKKYRGQDEYPRDRLVGETRMKIVIEPISVIERGLDRK
jgi:PPOX class probable F420-dependent enzyme